MREARSVPAVNHQAAGPDGIPGRQSMTVTSTQPYLRFAYPSITDAERQAVLEVLDSGWLTTGPKAKAFEERFAARVGVRHAIALNSATAALHLSVEALGVGPGDEVIVPTWTFAASGEVIAYMGARPVLVDVDSRTLNVTQEHVMAALTPRTKAVMVVHIAGLPAPVEQLVADLEPLGIPIVEDAAHAFPSVLGGPSGRYAGTIGKAGAFSFYTTKTITTGEGGMLVTNDDAIADRARLMSLHGISRDAWNRYSQGGSWFYEIEDPGFKYNMTDLAAALGLAQLGRADELLAARRELAAAYAARFSESAVADLVELPADWRDESHGLHLFIVRLALDRLTIDRSAVIAAMNQLAIGTSVHFIPLHLHPYYRKHLGYRADDFPVATREYERVMSLPLWPGMSAADVDRVVSGLETILGPARAKRGTA